MLSAPLRRDIKALIVRRHGTVKFFADHYGFKAQAVSDFLRGRTNAQVREAVALEQKKAVRNDSSINLDNSDEMSVSHRQNAEAK